MTKILNPYVYVVYLFDQLEANTVHDSFSPPCEENSSPSLRLAGRLWLFFRHKP